MDLCKTQEYADLAEALIAELKPLRNMRDIAARGGDGTTAYRAAKKIRSIQEKYGAKLVKAGPHLSGALARKIDNG